MRCPETVWIACLSMGLWVAGRISWNLTHEIKSYTPLDWQVAILYTPWLTSRPHSVNHPSIFTPIIFTLERPNNKQYKQSYKIQPRVDSPRSIIQHPSDPCFRIQPANLLPLDTYPSPVAETNSHYHPDPRWAQQHHVFGPVCLLP